MPEPTKKYQALVNLSIPQKFAGSDAANTRQTDLVYPGEILSLTDEQARNLVQRHAVPVIRPASEQNQPMPRITGMHLVNRGPAAQQFGARPDPAGSTVIESQQPLTEMSGRDRMEYLGKMSGARLGRNPGFSDPTTPVAQPQQTMTMPGQPMPAAAAYVPPQAAQAPPQAPGRQAPSPARAAGAGEAMDIPPRRPPRGS